jgi:hypothetical protein
MHKNQSQWLATVGAALPSDSNIFALFFLSASTYRKSEQDVKQSFST